MLNVEQVHPPVLALAAAAYDTVAPYIDNVSYIDVAAYGKNEASVSFKLRRACSRRCAITGPKGDAPTRNRSVNVLMQSPPVQMATL
jgi:hypothetical protein